MEDRNAIINYLLETYAPEAVIVYGSYAAGDAGDHSDFDALVITDRAAGRQHDGTCVGHTLLDVFLYPPETFCGDYDPEEFLQICDGKILLDREGRAEALMDRVRDYAASRPRKTEQELRQALAWCEKMLDRTLREDAEGYYRWHWLLTDSLSIYCDVRGVLYRGPKKTLRYMEETDRSAFELYARALKQLDREPLKEWLSYLKELFLERVLTLMLEPQSPPFDAEKEETP